MKIYRRVQTWVMIGILLLIPIGGCLLDLDMTKDENRWRENTEALVKMYKEMLDDPKTIDREGIRRALLIEEYRLTHNIPPTEDRSMWGIVGKSTGLVSIVTMFTAVIAAGIVAGEFSWGTIKLLLIRPASRMQVLLSKYLAVLLFAITMLALLFGGCLLAGGIFFGFKGTDLSQLVIRGGQVHEMNMVLYLLQAYAFKAVNLVMIASFAFMISTVFRSSTLAIALSLTMLFVGNTVTVLFRNETWAKYLLFSNTDLTQYTNGTPFIEGMTAAFSVAVLAAYFVLFMGSSFLVFAKRDIANG